MGGLILLWNGDTKLYNTGDPGTPYHYHTIPSNEKDLVIGCNG